MLSAWLVIPLALTVWVALRTQISIRDDMRENPVHYSPPFPAYLIACMKILAIWFVYLLVFRLVSGDLLRGPWHVPLLITLVPPVCARAFHLYTIRPGGYHDFATSLFVGLLYAVGIIAGLIAWIVYMLYL